MSVERRDELARAGLEHLQAAAREVIQATRSLLDAAEELVDDPHAVQDLVGGIAAMAQTAAARLRTTEPPDHGADDGDEDGGSVQRIKVS
jgi:hypothetical protein